MGKFLAILLLVLSGVAAATWHERQPATSAFMRGRDLATQLGCAGCHLAAHSGVVANPGSLRGVIPDLHAGASMENFWAGNRDEFAEWVRLGTSQRILKERASFGAERAATIHMPAYGNHIDNHQIDDLYTYFRDSSRFALPTGTAIERGHDIAAGHGCFACHGEHGLAGSANPGSFKGYIPPWEGEDFNALVHDDTELREWIHDGETSRFTHNPLAHYFLSQQQIKMPAYRSQLSDAELHDLIAYIRWLPLRAAANAGVNTPPATTTINLPATDGHELFNRSGCPTCHKPEGLNGFSDKNGNELPARARIAWHLRVQGDMIIEREGRGNNNLCDYYRQFDREYTAVYHTILDGKEINNHDNNHNNNHNNSDDGNVQTTTMPAWRDRAAADDTLTTEQQISALIRFLVSDEASSTSPAPAQIDSWREQAKHCTAPVETAAPSSTPSSLATDTARREQIRARVSALGKERKLFANEPHVVFPSFETNLLDIIGYSEDGDLDLWTLMQLPFAMDAAQAARRYDLDSFPSQQRYVIAVDKSAAQYRAYFFTLDLTPDLAQAPRYFGNNSFADANMTGCFACHTSGPRRLRPALTAKNVSLTPQDRDTIDTFNRRQLGYGAMITDWPASIAPLTAEQRENTRFPECVSCHDNNALRAPLLRYHRKPVDALMHLHATSANLYTRPDHAPGAIAEMPPLLPLDEAHIQRITQWFDHAPSP